MFKTLQPFIPKPWSSQSALAEDVDAQGEGEAKIGTPKGVPWEGHGVREGDTVPDGAAGECGVTKRKASSSASAAGVLCSGARNQAWSLSLSLSLSSVCDD